MGTPDQPVIIFLQNFLYNFLLKQGAWLLFFMRGSMGIAYHVFATIWTVTLKQRFDFGPKDHAYFMGWVGLWYALSQGVFAKKFIKYAGEDPTNVILACVVILALGRVLALMTSSLFTVYGVMATVIVALGQSSVILIFFF